MIQTALAWDTASPHCSIALVQQSAESCEVLAEFTSDSGLSSQVLPPQAARLLKEAGLTWAEVDLLAVGRGPGSFTALRTGLSLAKGLALGAQIPLLGFPTLDILAAQIFISEPKADFAAPIIDAHHGEVFCAIYRRDDESSSPELVSEARPITLALLPEKLAEFKGHVALAGPAANLVNKATCQTAKALKASFLSPSAVILAQTALTVFQTNSNTLQYPPHPLYLRQPDIRN